MDEQPMSEAVLDTLRIISERYDRKSGNGDPDYAATVVFDAGYLTHHASAMVAEIQRLRRAESATTNFATVMDILDAALTGDAEKARGYAALLADRYDAAGRP